MFEKTHLFLFYKSRNSLSNRITGINTSNIRTQLKRRLCNRSGSKHYAVQQCSGSVWSSYPDGKNTPGSLKPVTETTLRTERKKNNNKKKKLRLWRKKKSDFIWIWQELLFFSQKKELEQGIKLIKDIKMHWKEIAFAFWGATKMNIQAVPAALPDCGEAAVLSRTAVKLV